MEERLGVGAVLSGSFGLFFRRLHVLMPLAFVPYMLMAAASTFLIPVADPFGTVAAGNAWAAIALQFVFFLVSLWVAAIVTLAALDMRARRALRLGYYVARGLGALTVIVVLSIAFAVMVAAVYAVAFGFLFLVGVNILDAAFLPEGPTIAIIFLVMLLPTLAALYLGARFGLFPTIAVAEPVGLGALGRASQLTAGHRWGVLGSYLLALVCLLLMFIAVGFVAGIAIAVLAGLGDPTSLVTPGTGMMFTINAIGAVVNSFSIAFIAAYLAVVYARLRELKEGIDVETLETVFE
ncbi:MAG: hypothetical protein AAFY59_04420 [Pseudomonadota bacterium]